MRVLLIILAVGAIPAAVASLWMQTHPLPPAPVEPVRSVVWADRVFTSSAGLRAWLTAHGGKYERWARTHRAEAAILEHRGTRTRQIVRQPPPERRGWYSAARRAWPALLLPLAAIVLLAVSLVDRVRRTFLPRRLPASFGVAARRVNPQPLVRLVGHSVRAIGTIHLGASVAGLLRDRRPKRAEAQLTAVQQSTIGEGERNGSTSRVVELGRRQPANAESEAPRTDIVVKREANGHDVLPAERSPQTVLVLAASASQERALPEAVSSEMASPAEAAQQEPAPVRVPQAQETGPPPHLCTIVCWRGYTKAHFYARPPHTDAAIVSSPSFSWRIWEAQPRDAAAGEAALDKLVADLEASGWQQVRRGHAWYELRFGRTPDPVWEV
jgi:hypothetical protein